MNCNQLPYKQACVYEPFTSHIINLFYLLHEANHQHRSKHTPRSAIGFCAWIGSMSPAFLPIFIPISTSGVKVTILRVRIRHHK